MSSRSIVVGAGLMVGFLTVLGPEQAEAQAATDTTAIAKVVASRAIIDARELNQNTDLLVVVAEGPFARMHPWFIENAPAGLLDRRRVPPECSRGIGKEAVGLALAVGDLEIDGSRAVVNVTFACGGATQHMSTAAWSYVYQLEQVNGVWLPADVKHTLHASGRVGM
jgi:hypothetical protein